MDRLLNLLRAQAAGLDQSVGQPRFGIVTSLDSATATAQVTLQPEGVLSGWLPILSPWVGAGWGLYCPPAPGDQVLVVPQEGSAEHGVIVGCAFSTSQQPPAAEVGEIWIMHSSGTSIKLANTGSVEINGPVAITGSVSVSGDLHVAGNVFDSENALADLRQKYDVHTHIDSRGGVTSPPSPQD